MDKKECSELHLASLGYTPVEYLEATEKQYIDTNLLVKDKYLIDVRFQYTRINSSSEDWIIGDWLSGYGILIGIYRSDFIAYAGNERNSGIRFSTPYDLNIHTVLLTDKNVVFDGEAKTNTDYDSIPNKNITLKVFRSNHTYSSNYSRRVYYLKIYSLDSVLIRNYIPVIDSSNRPCLFDQVEQKCYYNQGTGEFLYG